MPQATLVSILIPAHNAGRYLRRCLDSVARQTYANLEVIIFDDGSDDDTYEVAFSYKSRFQSFSIIRFESVGQTEARFRLIGRADGEYSLFVDADDEIEPEMVATLYDAAKRYDSPVAICGLLIPPRTINKSKRTVGTVLHKDGLLSSLLCGESVINSLCVKLIRTDVLRCIKPRTDILHGEDLYIIWEVFKRINLAVVIDKPLYIYHQCKGLSSRGFSKATYSIRLVWEHIHNDCASSYNNLEQTARTLQALSNLWLLWLAARCNYKENLVIQNLRHDVSAELGLILESNSMLAKKVFALVAVSNYRVARFIASTFFPIK